MTSVLIVDDHAEARAVLRSIVQNKDTVVDEASSADEAVRLIQQHGRPDVAICDVQMPGKDGLWLAERLQTHWPETAVVMTSGTRNYEVTTRCFRLNVTDWIPKPINLPRVKEALAHAAAVRATRVPSRASAARGDSALLGDPWALSLDVNLWSGIEAALTLVRRWAPDLEFRASRRAKLSVNIALALGLSEPEVSDIELAALLREIVSPDFPTDDRNLIAVSIGQLDGRSLVDILRRVPALSGASDLLLGLYDFEAGGADSRDVNPQSRLGANIINMVLQFDRLTMRPDAPIGESEAVTLLGARYRRAEFNRVALAALRALRSVPDGPEATLVRWLDESRQRRKEASMGGNVSAIRAANAAYSELLGCALERLGSLERGSGGEGVPRCE